MKIGTVCDRGRLFPKAECQIERSGNDPVPLVAYIDTGFTEWLALPPNAIERLGLRLVASQRIRFGNLAREMINVYQARVNWCGNWHSIRVHELPREPTIGMELLRGHRIEFDALGDAEIDVEAVKPWQH